MIADNASTDATLAIARALAFELPHTTVLHLELKGRGRALRAAWSAGDADVLCYMDVDLSTDLRALLPLVRSLISGHSELAIGSRLARGARVSRGAKREFISRSYNRLLRLALRARLQRRPVRLQGDPGRRRPPAAGAGRRIRAGSSTPSCWSWPSARGCASTRWPSTGSTTPTPGWTSSAPRWPTCVG